MGQLREQELFHVHIIEVENLNRNQDNGKGFQLDTENEGMWGGGEVGKKYNEKRRITIKNKKLL